MEFAELDSTLRGFLFYEIFYSTFWSLVPFPTIFVCLCVTVVRKAVQVAGWSHCLIIVMLVLAVSRTSVGL